MFTARTFVMSFGVLALAGTCLGVDPRVHVNSAAAGANDGSSWADAYTSLESALQTAPENAEIWVARGTYVPSGARVCMLGPPPFQLRSRVAIYGGFAGTETMLAARNFTANVTILSGDIGRNDPGIRTDNSYNVIYDAGSDSSAILDGFTVTGGTGGNGAGNTLCLGGAGLRLENSQATIRNCVISNTANTAVGSGPETPGANGGGAYIIGGGPTFEHCTFTGNAASSGSALGCSGGSPLAGYGLAGSGGAVYITAASPQFLGCTFVNNAAGQGAAGVSCLFAASPGRSGGSGGAVYAVDSASQFRDCVFQNNSAGAGGNGGGTSGGPLSDGLPGQGGGLLATGGSITLSRCVFVGNATASGGSGGCGGLGQPVPGVDGGAGGGASLINCAAVIDGCRFIANHTGNGGTGAGCSASMGGISASRNGGAGAAVWVSGGSVLVVSSIFDANRTGAGGPAQAGTFPVPAGLSGVETVTGSIVNCTFVGNADANGVNLDAGRFGGTNSIVWTPGDPGTPVDPRFVNASGADGVAGTLDDDFRLRLTSPFVDAGNNALVPAGFTMDADGNSRFVDVASVLDTGVGTAPIVDLGALEAAVCVGDFNGSGAVSVQDIFDFLNAWFAGDARADVNGSGGLTVQDILDFVGMWFAGC